MRLIAALLLSAALVACSASSGKQQSGPAPSAAARLAAISDADASQYAHLPSMKQWRNPYLIVSQDGISFFDVSNSEERVLKENELLDTLAGLTSSAWPYGRVVAVQEVGISQSEEANAAIRRNRAILAGTLEEAKILIEWVPSPVQAHSNARSHP